jgi:hypothetical protein
VLLFPPPFSPNQQFASFGNGVFSHHHQQLSNHNFKTVEVLCEYHGHMFIMSLESGEKLKPENALKPLCHLWVSFNNFYALRFQPDDFSTFL